MAKRVEATHAELIGLALVKLLDKSPADGPDEFLRLLQKWNKPFEVLTLITRLTDAGVAVTITERSSYLLGKETKANNLKKARAAKMLNSKQSGKSR